MGLGGRAVNREVWIDGQRFQEEIDLRKFMVTLEAQKTARKSQWSFLTHLTLQVENEELRVMFSDMVRLLLLSSLRWKTTAQVALIYFQ